MTVDQQIALFAAVFPVLILVGGFLLNRKLEIERDDRHRKQEREWRRIDIQREVIAELQDALSDLARGTAFAVLIVNMPQEANPTGEMRRLDAPWYLEWLKAEARVVVLSTRVNNPRLKQLARDFVDFKNQIQSAVADPNDPQALRKILMSIDEPLREADALAGQLYLELYAPEPQVSGQKRRLRLSGSH